MKTILLTLLFMAPLFFSCQKDKNEIIDIQLPEDPDWYVLKAPDGRSVNGVYGDIDGTLLITTGLQIYQTKDKGKTWKASNYKENVGLFSFTTKADTLLVFSTRTTTKRPGSESEHLAKDPGYFSLDQGLTWSRYKSRYDRDSLILPLNHVRTLSGTAYKIKEITLENHGSIIVGAVESSLGTQLNLPQKHYIQSLYLDSKSRIYVSTDPPVCETSTGYALCNGQTDGVLYVSKRALK